MKSRECITKELQQQGIIFLTNKQEKLLQTFWNQITAFDNNQNLSFLSTHVQLQLKQCKQLTNDRCATIFVARYHLTVSFLTICIMS